MTIYKPLVFGIQLTYLVKKRQVSVATITRSLPRDGGAEDSTETQQSDHALRSRPEINGERRRAKMASRRGSDAGNSLGTVKKKRPILQLGDMRRNGRIVNFVKGRMTLMY